MDLQEQRENLAAMGLCMRPMATVGRSLVALKPFPAGTEILSDEPIVRWAGDSALPVRLENLRTNTSSGEEEEAPAVAQPQLVPKFLAAAALAFMSLNSRAASTASSSTPAVSPAAPSTPMNEHRKRSLILDMHIPDLPTGHRSTIELYAFAKRVASFIWSAFCSSSSMDLFSLHEDVLSEFAAPSGRFCAGLKEHDLLHNELFIELLDDILGAGHQALIEDVQEAKEERKDNCEGKYLDPTKEGSVSGVKKKVENRTYHSCPSVLLEYLQQLVLHSMFAAKVNSHRTSSGQWCLFPDGSKFAHSCDPNVMYVLERQAFVAVRDIAVGEHLHFNYAGGRTILMSTEHRQKGLQSSHLFLCRCARCEGPDYARQILCPLCKRDFEGKAASDEELLRHRDTTVGYIVRKGSPLQLLDIDVFPEKLWRCSLHPNQHQFTDEELKSEQYGKVLVKEKQCETAVAALTNGKYQYKPMKALCLLIGETLGRRHWTYASLCQHFSLYFRQMVRSGCSAARHLTFGWGMRFLDALETQGFIKTKQQLGAVNAANTAASGDDCTARPPKIQFPHMVAAAHITTMAQVCGPVARYHEPLTQLSFVILPLVLALYDASDSRVQHVRSLAYNIRRPEPAPNPALSPEKQAGEGRSTGGTSPVSEASSSGTIDSNTTTTTTTTGGVGDLPCSLGEVLTNIGPRAKARVQGKKMSKKGGEGEEGDFDEDALFNLWDRFVVLMALKQASTNNSRSSATTAGAMADASTSSVGLSSAGHSLDSLDSFASFD